MIDLDETTEIDVSEIVEGDWVDLESCPTLHGRPEAEYQYAAVEVIEIDNATDDVRIGYSDFGYVEYERGQTLRIKRRELR